MESQSQGSNSALALLGPRGFFWELLAPHKARLARPTPNGPAPSWPRLQLRGHCSRDRAPAASHPSVLGSEDTWFLCLVEEKAPHQVAFFPRPRVGAPAMPAPQSRFQVSELPPRRPVRPAPGETPACHPPWTTGNKPARSMGPSTPAPKRGGFKVGRPAGRSRTPSQETGHPSCPTGLAPRHQPLGAELLLL